MEKKKTETEIQQLNMNNIKLNSAIQELRYRAGQIHAERLLDQEQIRKIKKDIQEVTSDAMEKNRVAQELRESTKRHLISIEELELIRLKAIKDRIELNKKKEQLVEECRQTRSEEQTEESLVAIPDELFQYQKKMNRIHQ